MNSGERIQCEEVEIYPELVYEIKSFKAALPQIIATIIVTSYNMLTGMSIAYSGILTPEIGKNTSELQVTTVENSWIVSSTSLSMGLTTLFLGFLPDKFGRLKVLRFSSIPIIIGWILIACAMHKSMLLLGRILIGVGNGLSLCSEAAYISEISWPNLRGTLLFCMCVTSSLGVELVYLKGFFMSWRAIAWSCVFYTSIIFGLTFSIYESPMWLISRGRLKCAKKSLSWYHKYHNVENFQENPINSHFALLKNEHEKKLRATPEKISCNFLLKKRIWKPTLILIGLAIIQQFSGIYVILSYAITFFERIGCNIDPLIASNLITSFPLLLSVFNILIIKRIGRRIILITSSLSGGFCLCISALFTKWIQEERTQYKWVPVLFILLFITSVIVGLEPIPWNLIPELYPVEIRGFATGIMGSLSSFLMFSALYSYEPLNCLLGGAVGIQVFYAIVCFIGALYVYDFVPETHCKTLTEIDKYFE